MGDDRQGNKQNPVQNLTLAVLRLLRDERQPVLVPHVAKRLGWPDDADLHPVRQVLNHLSRDRDGVDRAGKFGSFTYYERTADIDAAIERREAGRRHGG